MKQCYFMYYFNTIIVFTNILNFSFFFFVFLYYHYLGFDIYFCFCVFFNLQLVILVLQTKLILVRCQGNYSHFHLKFFIYCLHFILFQLTKRFLIVLVNHIYSGVNRAQMLMVPSASSSSASVGHVCSPSMGSTSASACRLSLFSGSAFINTRTSPFLSPSPPSYRTYRDKDITILINKHHK